MQGLLAAQFPEWANLSIELLPSSGTSNAIFRLGDEMSVGLPRNESAEEGGENEYKIIPKLAPHLPLTIPAPSQRAHQMKAILGIGSFILGSRAKSADVKRPSDLRQAANDLANFLIALQRIDTDGGQPAADRGLPLQRRDDYTRQSIAALSGQVDIEAVTKAWEMALKVPQWNHKPVWFHGDMLPSNLLVDNGHLSAVIDFGGCAVGDPACYLIIAWALFSGESRNVFRNALSIDDETWDRGRGWALSWALIYIPYYQYTNPAGVAVARHTVDEVLNDLGLT